MVSSSSGFDMWFCHMSFTQSLPIARPDRPTLRAAILDIKNDARPLNHCRPRQYFVNTVTKKEHFIAKWRKFESDKNVLSVIIFIIDGRTNERTSSDRRPCSDYKRAFATGMPNEWCLSKTNHHTADNRTLASNPEAWILCIIQALWVDL